MFEISHITKSCKKNPVLSDISFSIQPGECIGLIGPNGSGKSTLLSIASGILKPDFGEVSFHSVSLTKKPKLFSQYVGYVPQTNPLFEDVSVLEHLKLWYSASSYSLEEDLKNGFPARLGIPAYLTKKVCELSGGMKKRVSLACAMANRPQVLLFDEPAAALDLIGKEEIRQYLRELKDMKKSILLATHEEEDFSLCDRLIFLGYHSYSILPANTSVSEILSLLSAQSSSTSKNK